MNLWHLKIKFFLIYSFGIFFNFKRLNGFTFKRYIFFENISYHLLKFFLRSKIKSFYFLVFFISFFFPAYFVGADTLGTLTEAQVVEAISSSPISPKNRANLSDQVISAVQTNDLNQVQKFLDQKVSFMVRKDGKTPFMRAIDLDLEDMIRLILTQASLSNRQKKSALVWAMEKDHDDIINLILKSGVNLKFRGSNEESLLVQLMKMGKEEFIPAFIENGASVHVKDGDGKTPLMRAIDLDLRDTVRLILTKISFVDRQKEFFNQQKKLALIWAMKKGHDDIINLILKSGVNLQFRGGDEENLLVQLMEMGKEEFIPAFIESGASFHGKDKDGKSPLMRAIDLDLRDTVRLILTKISFVDRQKEFFNQQKKLALIWAMKKGHDDIINLILKSGVNLQFRGGDEENLLVQLMEMGKEEFIPAFIESGASFHGKDKDGKSPLMRAIDLDLLDLKDTMRLVLTKNSLSNYQKKLALLWAMRKDHDDIINLILKSGVNLQFRGGDEENLLVQLMEMGKEEFIPAFIESGASFHGKDKDGKNPLMRAIDLDLLDLLDLKDTIRLVLTKNSLSNYQKKLALLWAMRKDHDDIINLILKSGVNLKSRGGNEKRPLLVQLMEMGKEEFIPAFIESGASIHAKDRNGETVLMHFVEKNSINNIEILLDAGADVNAPSWKTQITPLIKAIKMNNKKLVELFLQKGVDIHKTDGNGKTPLMWAAQKGHIDILEILLKKGAKVNVVDNETGKTALLWACIDRKIASVKKLVEFGASVNIPDHNGVTPLMWVLRSRYTGIGRFLLSVDNIDVDAQDKDGKTALMWAAQEGRVNFVEFLLEKGADVRKKDKKGWSAVDWAFHHGKLDIINMRLKKGITLLGVKIDSQKPTQDEMIRHRQAILEAVLKRQYRVVKDLIEEKVVDINSVKNNDGENILFSAVSQGHTGIVKLLVRAGARVNLMDNHKRSPLMLSVRRSGNRSMVKFLIEKGANLNFVSQGGLTVLMWAVRSGDEDIVRLLIEKRAHLNAQDYEGRTAFIWAIKNGFTELVQLLLEKGADANVRDEKGKTALMWATQEGYVDIVNILLKQKGIGKNIRDKQGKTALMWAAQKGHIDTFDILLKQKGIGKEVRDQQGRNILMLASGEDRVDMIKHLIENGVDIFARDKVGRTALMWAAQKGSVNAMKVLIEKGADLEEKYANNKTALVLSAGQGHLNVIETFIKDIPAEERVRVFTASFPNRQKRIIDKQMEIINFFMEKGIVDINVPQNYYKKDRGTYKSRSVLTRLIYRKKIDMAKFFINSPFFDVHVKDSTGPLIQAAREGFLSLIKLLIKRGVDLHEEKDSAGRTPLMWAAYKGHTSVVRFLLEQGVDINAQSQSGRIALMWAIAGGRLNIVRLLVKSGADLNLRDNNAKVKALTWARVKKLYGADYLLSQAVGDGSLEEIKKKYDSHRDMRLINALASEEQRGKVKFLLAKNDFDPYAEDDRGWTALMWAMEQNYIEEAKELISKGCDVNAVDKEGWSVLRWAVEYDQVDIVKILLESGADVNVQDKEERTALMDAVRDKREVEIVKLLLSYGAEVDIQTEIGLTVMDFLKENTHPEIKASLFQAQREEEGLFRYESKKDGIQNELFQKIEDEKAKEDGQLLEKPPCVRLLVS